MIQKGFKNRRTWIDVKVGERPAPADAIKNEFGWIEDQLLHGFVDIPPL